ncbi:hypothetical protein ACQCVP_19210 [Rossellomorea vietnamensis]|uniref:hypothetical protein n=1 Tax=Rossellomorea vietnamensis TaxID=218284 RepID=UPI003CE76BF8
MRTSSYENPEKEPCFETGIFYDERQCNLSLYFYRIPDKKNSYGEIYLTDSSHITYVFRGFERQAVLKEAKKRIEDK